MSSRTHRTTFLGLTSSAASINASVVQGSVLGPTLFNLNSSELAPFSPLNKYHKYADDSYLVIPSCNVSSITAELADHSAWAASCNLKLNPSKTSELVFSRKGQKMPPTNPGITRVTSLRILGVVVDDKLNFSEHVDSTVSKCSQALFALRMMRQHGMPSQSLLTIFRSTLVSKLQYACQSWWGFLTKGSLNKMDGFLRRSKKLGYCKVELPDVTHLFEAADTSLFKRVACNPEHVLYPLLPPQRQSIYNLRKRAHNFSLTHKDDRNFINRMLFHKLY